MKEHNSTYESVDLVWHYFLYDGSVSDILINYILIIIYSLALLWPYGGCRRPRAIFTLLHTSLCVSLQVGCWVLAEAYGISLIWCGQMGQLSIIIMEMVKVYIKLDRVKAYINALLQTWKKHFSREVYGKLICCLPGTIAIIYYYTRWISLKFLTLIAFQSTLLNSKPFQFSSDNNYRPSTCFGCWSSAGCPHSVSQR